MKNRILVSIGVFVLIVAALGGLGVWLGLPCGPSTCLAAGWLYDFQNMIAGLAAVLAAGVAAFVPEYYRRHAAHQSQIQNSNRVVLEILMLGSHLAATLFNIRDARKERPAVAFGVELPSLQSLVRQSRGMLESVGALLSGPDDEALLRVMWRLSSFRNAVERADNLAALFQHELEESGTEFIADAGIEAVAVDLQEAGSAELPIEMQAAFFTNRRDRRR